MQLALQIFLYLLMFLSFVTIAVVSSDSHSKVLAKAEKFLVKTRILPDTDQTINL